MRPMTFFYALVTLMLSSSLFAENIIFPAPMSDSDQRHTYVVTLLNRILAITDKPEDNSSLAFYKTATPRERTFELMRQGKIHIAAEAEKPNWSKELILIPIPIRKGTMGFRLFLVHQDHQQEIAQTQSLEALKAWPTGSGYQWSIRKVLEENQFNVVTSKSYEGLFDMLNAKRFVTFSRGINEIFSEYEQFKKDIPNVALDQHIAIHIPLPNYFFISPKHKALAERVEKGLKMLIDNGEFEEIFMAHHKDIIEKAKLAERKIFYLDNKNLSKQSLKAIKNEKYWLKP